VALVLISPVVVLARTRKNDTKYADERMSLLRLKYHQLGSFNNRNALSPSSGGRESHDKVLTDSVLVRTPVPAYR